MLNLTNITVSFGGRDLYKNISFQINTKDKIGVVGKNGAGKSTMLKLITGEQKASSGQINSVKSLSIGYLPQELNVESENSILNKLGNIMADYQLSKVKVEEYFDAFSLTQDKKYVDYALDPYTNLEESEELYQKIHRIDRAYATKDEDIFVTEIARKNWPITPIKCYHFATNFFKSAKLLGAFKVDGVIDYTWQDAKQIV